MILNIEHLSHKYSSNWAVRDINLAIEGTGVTGLLGSNGAGKSTTMNIVCGVLNPTKGKVIINGFDLQEMPEKAKRDIGFLPQTPPLYIDLTVEEYLIYSAELRQVDKKMVKSAVAEASERCGIAHVSQRLIRNLSGGYKQRVAIAQAIIHKPKLIVMDEPTNGLDPNQLIEVRKLIREIGEDHSVLLSSHILSEINLLCKDIVMLDGGQIVFSDSMSAFNNYVQAEAVIVRMDNPPSESVMMAVEGVTRVEMLNDKQARIFFEGDDGVVERLLSAGVAGGWRIKEATMDKGVLDEIFKQISNKNQKS